MSRYLEIEKLCYRWVRVSGKRVQQLIECCMLPEGFQKFGHVIQNANNASDAQILEFHIDTSEALVPFISESGKEFGGDLRQDFPPNTKPVMIIGQDESTFESNLKNGDTWVDKDGRGDMRPKGRGYGIMASLFISREFGAGIIFQTRK